MASDTGLAQVRMAQILEATIILVSQRGGDNVRLRDISQATGLSIGTLQHYFITRDYLMNAAFLRHHEQVIASIDTANDSTVGPWQRVCRMIDALTQPETLLLRSKLWVEMASQASRDEQIREAAHHVYDLWRRAYRRTIREGIECGEFTPALPVDHTISAILAAVDGYEIALTFGVESPELVGERLKHIMGVLLAPSSEPSASPAVY